MKRNIDRCQCFLFATQHQNERRMNNSNNSDSDSNNDNNNHAEMVCITKRVQVEQFVSAIEGTRITWKIVCRLLRNFVYWQLNWRAIIFERETIDKMTQNIDMLSFGWPIYAIEYRLISWNISLCLWQLEGLTSRIWWIWYDFYLENDKSTHMLVKSKCWTIQQSFIIRFGHTYLHSKSKTDSSLDSKLNENYCITFLLNQTASFRTPAPLLMKRQCSSCIHCESLNCVKYIISHLI